MSHPFRRLSALLLLVLVFSACRRDPEVSRAEYVARAEKYAQNKNVDAAIIEYRNALQADAKYVEGYRKLTSLYLARGDGRSAMRSALTAADLAPQSADAQLEAGTLLLLAGRFADAKARAEAALKVAPQSAPAHILLGNATAGLKDVTAATRQFEEAIRLDPQQSTGYISLGVLHRFSGDLQAAEKSFQDAVAADARTNAGRLALAQFYWSTDRLPEAERTLKEAIAQHPHDADAHVALALVLQTMNRSQEAEPYLRAAVDEAPSARTRLALADYYIRQQRPGDARPLLQALAATPETAVEATVRLASIADSQGRADEALRLLDGLLKTAPADPNVLAAKSDVLRGQRDFDGALRVADVAVRVAPQSVFGHFARAQVLAAMAQYSRAEQEFTQVLQLNPEAVAAQVELARLKLRNGIADPAVALAAEASRAEPQRIDAKLVLARGLILKHDYARARGAVNDAVSHAPSSAAAQVELGFLLGLQKDLPGARAAFQRGLELNPASVGAVAGLTALDMAASNRVAALARLDDQVKRFPTNTGFLLLAGQTRLAVRDLPGAEQVLVRAIQLDPSALPAYGMLGQIYVTQGRLDEAVVQFEKLAATVEKPVGALTAVGTIYELQNRPADARKAYERALALDPNAAVAANNLAWMYAESDVKLDVAMQLAETARTGLPDRPEVHDTLGWLRFKRNEMSGAIESLQKSVALDPSNVTATYHLALAFEKSGDKNRAERTLQQYLRLDSSSERSQDVRRRLEALGG
jgi:tetratricopeptide (TPR) repeat protein